MADNIKNNKITDESLNKIIQILKEARIKDRRTYWVQGGLGILLPPIISLFNRWIIPNPPAWLIFSIYLFGFVTLILAAYFYQQENIKRLEFLQKMVYREQEIYDSDGKIKEKIKGGVIDSNSVDIVRTLFS